MKERAARVELEEDPLKFAVLTVRPSTTVAQLRQLLQRRTGVSAERLAPCELALMTADGAGGRLRVAQRLGDADRPLASALLQDTPADVELRWVFCRPGTETLSPGPSSSSSDRRDDQAPTPPELEAAAPEPEPEPEPEPPAAPAPAPAAVAAPEPDDSDSDEEHVELPLQRLGRGILAGHLRKAAMDGAWVKCWCVLTSDRLWYWRVEDEARAAPISLVSCSVLEGAAAGSGGNTLEMHTPRRVYRWRAHSDKAQQRWIAVLRHQAELATENDHFLLAEHIIADQELLSVRRDEQMLQQERQATLLRASLADPDVALRFERFVAERGAAPALAFLRAVEQYQMLPPARRRAAAEDLASDYLSSDMVDVDPLERQRVLRFMLTGAGAADGYPAALFAPLYDEVFRNVLQRLFAEFSSGG